MGLEYTHAYYIALLEFISLKTLMNPVVGKGKEQLQTY